MSVALTVMVILAQIDLLMVIVITVVLVMVMIIAMVVSYLVIVMDVKLVEIIVGQTDCIFVVVMVMVMAIAVIMILLVLVFDAKIVEVDVVQIGKSAVVIIMLQIAVLVIVFMSSKKAQAFASFDVVLVLQAQRVEVIDKRVVSLLYQSAAALASVGKIGRKVFLHGILRLGKTMEPKVVVM